MVPICKKKETAKLHQIKKKYVIPPHIKKLIQEIKNKKTKQTFKTKQEKIIFTFKIIQQYKNKLSLNKILQALKLSKDTYYRWRDKVIFLKNKPLKILKKIKKIVRQGYYTPTNQKPRRRWGYRLVHAILQKKGVKISCKRVYQLMKKYHLLSNHVKNKKSTRKYQQQAKQNNLFNLLQIKNNQGQLKPYFKAKKLKKILVTDITYIKYQHQKTLYLMAIMDLANREIISYHIAEKQDLNFVFKTLNKLKKIKANCILHSDRGSVFTSQKYLNYLKNRQIKASFSDKASPTQNACIESFWANFKKETLYLENPTFLTKTAIMQKIKQYIKYYNHKRPSTYNNYLSPVQARKQLLTK